MYTETALYAETMFEAFLNEVVAAIVWAVANGVYYDKKRRGEQGFGRFVAFWVGNPATWITFFAVREGRSPNFEPQVDDAVLFEEVERDRRRREALGAGEGGIEEPKSGEGTDE